MVNKASANQIGALMDWAITLTPEDLPTVPWEFRKGMSVINNKKFLVSLQRDIRRGPTKNPRARFGVLQEDVIIIWNLIGTK
tara:strand:+ start:3228 stop:3473 length:246 start_codon:yes stop_codon:yes gene_type:complete